jgi:hypothetical protein
MFTAIRLCIPSRKIHPRTRRAINRPAIRIAAARKRLNNKTAASRSDSPNIIDPNSTLSAPRPRGPTGHAG